jgi:hypothetical protein
MHAGLLTQLPEDTMTIVVLRHRERWVSRGALLALALHGQQSSLTLGQWCSAEQRGRRAAHHRGPDKHLHDAVDEP